VRNVLKIVSVDVAFMELREKFILLYSALIKNKTRARHRWLMHAILATWEAAISKLEASLGK
jgi:hypothetical protein